MADWYSWLKALHVIAVISWMAGLLYLPRLFVYHCAAEPGSVQSETFKVMERRLFRAIMRPAMAATWIFGALLIYTLSPGIWSEGWFHVKLTCVILMSLVHEFLGKQVRTFASDANTRPARFFRMLNEVPTLLMIIIVVMVLVRPF